MLITKYCYKSFTHISLTVSAISHQGYSGLGDWLCAKKTLHAELTILGPKSERATRPVLKMKNKNCFLLVKVKHQGITINSKLSWQSRISEPAMKLTRANVFISKIGHALTISHCHAHRIAYSTPIWDMDVWPGDRLAKISSTASPAYSTYNSLEHFPPTAILPQAYFVAWSWKSRRN